MPPSARLAAAEAAARAAVRSAGAVAGAVAALEATAAAASLGLSRPKFVGRATLDATPASLADALAGSARGSRPLGARPLAENCAARNAGGVRNLAAVAGAISDGALLDLLLSGTRAKIAAAAPPDVPSSSPAVARRRARADDGGAATPLVTIARETLVDDAAAELAAARSSSAAIHDDDGVSGGWGATFDALYSHTVMNLATLAVDGAVTHTVAHDATLHADAAVAPGTPPDVAAAQVRQATRVVRRRAAPNMRVAAALVAALQDLLADAAVVTLIREAVSADLAPAPASAGADAT